MAQPVVTPAMQADRETLDLQLQKQFYAQYVAASKYVKQRELGMPTGYADEATANAKIKAPLIRTLTQINSLFRAYNAGKDFIDLTQIGPGYLTEETLNGIHRQANNAFSAADDAMLQSIGSQPAITDSVPASQPTIPCSVPQPVVTAPDTQQAIAPWIQRLVAPRIQQLAPIAVRDTLKTVPQLTRGEAAIYRQIAHELHKIEIARTAPGVTQQTRSAAAKTRDAIETNLAVLDGQPTAANAASSIHALQELRQDYEKNTEYARAFKAARAKRH